MTPRVETASALYGATRLALFDQRGHSYFNTSTEGFWRSFQAALLISPLFAILLAERYTVHEVDAPLFRFLSVEFSAYAISWLCFPVIMEALTRSLGCRDKFVGFIVAYNWAMVPQYVIFTVVIILGMIGMLPGDLVDALTLLLLMWVFAYTGFITVTALEIPPGTAAGIVLMDFLLGLTIDLAIAV